LRQLVQKAESASKPRGTLARAKELLEMDQLITDEGAYGAGADNYMAFREKVARAIVGLRKLAGES
ncbi:MAG: hypothetical protein ACE5JM_13265, partial [Armatimonadota bacterium]